MALLHRFRPEHPHPSTPDIHHQRTPTPTRPLQNATYRTRSIGGPFSSAVVHERIIPVITTPPCDDEIIIAPIRITNPFRRASSIGSDDLPTRPPPRSLLRRISSRFSPPPDENKYTALKLPRGDYKRWFARDKDGNYAGTEVPEREWTLEELMEAFGKYQGMPLRSVPGAGYPVAGAYAVPPVWGIAPGC